MARQVPDMYAYQPGAAGDPVRPANPYVPTEVVVNTGVPSVPIVGVLVLAGIVLWFEHMRRKGGRR